MYGCPACGAGLRFDIASQKLHCDYCDNSYDPAEYDREKNAAERRDGYLDVTVYTCTQCGAEMVSTDNAVTGFCSYCGASAVLSSRLDSQPRPKKIIPFLKTKENCKEQYVKKTRYAIYAPKELRDSQFLERFRGIYIPYWLYRVTFKENASVPGRKVYRKGNYEYSEEYTINLDLKGGYRDLAYDASVSFNDRLADTIAPFSHKKMKPFRSGYLCGFYADMADVDKETYIKEAKESATDYALRSLEQKLLKTDVTVSLPDSEAAKEALVGTSCEDADGGLFPVWFLTWRRKDRVAYSVVNGETGRVFADLPVDLGRFFTGSAITAVILYILAEWFLFMMPPTALSAAALMALIAAAAFYRASDKITSQDIHADDKGFWSDVSPEDPGFQEYEKYKKKEKDNSGFLARAGRFALKFIENGLLPVLAVMFLSMNVLGTVFSMIGRLTIGFGATTSTEAVETAMSACIGTAILGTWYFIRTILLCRRVIRVQQIHPGRAALTEQHRNMIIGAAFAYAAQIVALVTVMLHPANDMIYYVASIICLLAVAATCVGLIQRYNLMATHPVPDFFDRKGGNDSAQDV